MTHSQSHSDNALKILIKNARRKSGPVRPLLDNPCLCRGLRHEPMLSAFILWYNDAAGSTKTVACCDKTLLPLNDKFGIDYETVCKGVRNEPQPVGV